MNHHNTFFRQIFLFLTKECPLRCEYCYVDRSSGKTDMTYDTIRQVIEKVRPRYRGGRGIVFFGGEPLLRVDLIERTLKDYSHLFPNGMGGVVTGATVNMDKFFPLYRDYVLDMQISYDGLMHNKTRGKDFNFQSLGPYLELKDKRFQLRKTVSCSNVDTLYDDYLFGSEMHFRYNISFDFAIAHQESFKNNFHNKLYNIYTDIWSYIRFKIEHDERVFIPLSLIKDLFHVKEYIGGESVDMIDSCEVGNILAVDVDGSCYPCTMLSQLGDEFKIGDVWNGIDLSINDNIRRNLRCDCSYANVCGGGCRWERYKLFGKEDMMKRCNTDHCKTLHIKYRTAMNFWDELKDEYRSIIEIALRNYSQCQKMTFDSGGYKKAHSIIDEINGRVDNLINCV